MTTPDVPGENGACAQPGYGNAQARSVHRHILAQPILHFARSADEIRMHVRFQNVFDMESFTFGDFDEIVYVPGWINHGSFFCPLVAKLFACAWNA